MRGNMRAMFVLYCPCGVEFRGFHCLYRVYLVFQWLIVRWVFLQASSQMTCGCCSVFQFINIWAKVCVGGQTEQEPQGIACQALFLYIGGCSCHMAPNPLLVITNLSMCSWCSCGQRGLTLCRHDSSKIYIRPGPLYVVGIWGLGFSQIQMAKVALLVFANAIIIYILPPAFHFHYVNNNYSNEPLGFGSV